MTFLLNETAVKGGKSQRDCVVGNVGSRQRSIVFRNREFIVCRCKWPSHWHSNMLDKRRSDFCRLPALADCVSKSENGSGLFAIHQSHKESTYSPIVDIIIDTIDD